ncbi:hypothetical protein SAMN05428975_0647 [Mucilaginibacter sp. OK268]|uniref:hypothetical protein n=1 Tax=Mucilaginibacter sp. OK268 TaxID=1881048 RepID=UPI0008875BA4|nr:hypothetical protein [Mucilaginibacter sp. OK268]SDP19358.1 hypothetical protein SAMN05428975_0647 [Mucilaginibacter sp. OK268]
MKIFSTFGNAYDKPYHRSDHGKSTSKIIPAGVHEAIHSLLSKVNVNGYNSSIRLNILRLKHWCSGIGKVNFI